MKYVNAKSVLPDGLLAELQKYIHGYLYIPAKDEHHKAWGELSGGRDELDKRNAKIADDYKKGISAEKLCEKYCLSIHSIRKILYRK